MRSVSVIRKPLESSVGIGIVLYSAGGLDIDSVRIGDGSESKDRTDEDSMSRRYTGRGGTDFAATPGVRGGGANGRWPANLVWAGDAGEIFPETSSGVMKAGTRRAAQDVPGSVCYGTYGGDATFVDTYGDRGSASRFFYAVTGVTK